MKKKLSIIGRGTAGCYAASHFAANSDLELELYYDPDTKVQTVGESGNVLLPKALQRNLGINYENMSQIDATLKLGITKLHWNDGKKYVNWFPPGTTSYHFYAYGLQNLILDRLKDRMKIIPARVDAKDIDSDFIMDCSGKPAEYDDFHYLSERDDSVPVNAVYVTECPWNTPKYNTTHAVARPYGWVFAVPLANRLSVGYLYNRNINTLDEVKEDVKEVFRELDVVPSERTQAFNFDNYYRKQNFDGRICYNGNRSFFLEPLEATSIWTMNYIQHAAHGVWLKDMPIDKANQDYQEKMKQIETCIMFHYFTGSEFDTEFWRFAKDRGERHMKRMLKNSKFQYALKDILSIDLKSVKQEMLDKSYGIWNLVMWAEHFSAWNTPNKLSELISR
jgi:hypothetical protein